MSGRSVRRRQDNNGSTVELHEDSVRRVAQCGCGASMVYRGNEKLWAAGWGSHIRNGVRYWECDACWTPQYMAPEQPIYRADPVMLEVAARPGGAGRERLGRQMVRLLEQDPPRGRAYLEAILEHVRKLSSSSAMRWRALHELVAAGALSGGRRPRRPAKPGKALPERRRVVGEVASEVVAVRLTPSEKRQGEELVAGGALGPWFRRMLQLAADGVPAEPPRTPTLDELLDELVEGEYVDALKRVCDAALERLDVVRRRRKERETRVLGALAGTLRTVDELVEQLGMAPDAVEAMLAELFIRGLVWKNSRGHVLRYGASKTKAAASVNGARRRTVRSTTTATVDRRAPAVAPSRARQR